MEEPLSRGAEMDITKELREWASIEVPYKYGHQLAAIADRIDAEYQKSIRELNNLADASVLLPVDADGVTWNVGERDEDDNTVIELRLTSSGWCVLTDGGLFYRPDIHRHYHAPTVEDVLREFAMEVAGKECMTVRSGVVDKYAAKLRLAGDAE